MARERPLTVPASNRRRNRWRVAVAVLMALVLTALLAVLLAIANLDVAAHRERIEALVSRSLDREVRIGGAIRLERSLRPRFVVEEVSVANPPWASRPLLASAQRLEVQVALWPLLARRIRIIEIRLIGADVRLERRADGTPNWIFGRKSDAEGETGVVGEVLSVGVERSRLGYRQIDGTEAAAVLEHLDTEFAPGQAVRVAFKGRYQNIPIELRVDGGTLEQFVSPAEPWHFRGKASVGGLRAELKGNATDPLRLAGVDLALSFRGTQAGGWRSVLTEHIPALAEYQGTGTFRSGTGGFAFEVRAEGSELELARLWSGRDADPALAIDARQVTLAGEGTAAEFARLLARASWQLTAQGAALRWRWRDGGPPLVLSDTEVTATAKPGGPIEAELKGSIAGQPYRARGTLGALDTLMAAKAPWPIDVTVSAGEARGEFHGALRKPLAPARLDATWLVSADRLSTLGAIAGFALADKGPARITGKLAYADAGLWLSVLDAAVADSRLRGEIAWQPKGSPRTRVTVAPSRIRLGDLRVAARPGADATKTITDADDGRVVPALPLTGTRLRDADIAVSIDRLEISDADKVHALVSGELRVANGRLRLQPLRSDVAGARVEASLEMDAGRNPVALDLQIKAESIDYGALLRASGVTDDVQGALGLRARIAGEGNDLRALLARASGEIEILGGEGRLRGKLLELWGGNLIQLLNPVAWAQGGDTELRCLAGQFDIGEGLARSRKLLVDSNNVTVAGELVINLENERIEGVFKPQPKEATLLHLGGPLRLSGTLKAPRVRPAERGIVTLGKVAIGVVQPAALIVLFGDLGTREKNPCAALLAQPVPAAAPDASKRE